MHGAIINRIVTARDSWRHVRRAGTGRLILNPISATEDGLGTMVVGAGFALQISEMLHKLGLKAVWVNIATGLTILVALACVALRLILDDHYLVDGQHKSISSRRTLFWVPVSGKVETDFENVECVAVNGLTLDENRTLWGYGVTLFTRSGKRMDLLTPTRGCSFETAHAICHHLATLLETRVHPEPMPERTVYVQLDLNRTWDPAGIGYKAS